MIAPQPYDLVSGRSGGEGSKRALRAAERLGEVLAAALKRAIPFLGRRGIPVTFAGASVTVPNDEEPCYTCAFDCPDRGTGRLTFDRSVSALLIDGLLGGDGKKPTPITAERLSRVQTAFMKSASQQILTALSEVAQKSHACVFRAREEAPTEGNPSASLTIELRVGEKGAITVHVPQSLFAGAEETSTPRGPDPRIVATLHSAPVEVSVELGRTRVAMRKLMGLTLGTTLVLDTAVDGRAILRVDGRMVAQGMPKTEAGHFAIRIDNGEPAAEEVGTTFPMPSLEA